MKQLELTDEQAKWLKKMLDGWASDRQWKQKSSERSDADLHADAIRDQLAREIDADKW